MAQFAFNPAEIQVTSGATQLPVSDSSGWLVQIVSSKMWVKKDATEQDRRHPLLALTFQIIEGPHKGLTGTQRYAIYAENPEAARISSEHLAAIFRVTRTGAVAQSRGDTGIPELHKKPFRAIVGQQSNNPKYTEIKYVTGVNGESAASIPPVTGPAQRAPDDSAPPEDMMRAAQQSTPEQAPAQSGSYSPSPEHEPVTNGSGLGAPPPTEGTDNPAWAVGDAGRSTDDEPPSWA